LPLKEFLVGDRLDIDPAVMAKRYVDVRLQRDRLLLIAGKYIGAIPLNDRFTLQIRPKVTVSSLLSILAIAREEPDVIAGLDQMYQAHRGLNLFELLVQALRRELSVLEQGGIHREYIRKSAEGSSYRGRLNVAETLRRQWATGAYHRATMTYFEHSRDVLINRVIYYTVWHVLRAYPAVAPIPDKLLLRDLDQALTWFGGVALDHTRSFLPGLRDLLVDQRIPYNRQYMRRLLNICRMLLDDLGVDIERTDADVFKMPPLVVDMERVFQRFLLFGMRDRLPAALACWDTSSERQQPLFRAPAAATPVGMTLLLDEREKAKPDFVVAEADVPLLIGDAKYKTNLARDDMYQVVAHSLAYGASDALLVFPADEPRQCGALCLGEVGRVRLFTYGFPLYEEDLTAALNDMVREIELITGSQPKRLVASAA
jgi:5-methylcytosine-specific restriction enzyme subunit McrC